MLLYMHYVIFHWEILHFTLIPMLVTYTRCNSIVCVYRRSDNKTTAPCNHGYLHLHPPRARTHVTRGVLFVCWCSYSVLSLHDAHSIIVVKDRNELLQSVPPLGSLTPLATSVGHRNSRELTGELSPAAGAPNIIAPMGVRRPQRNRKPTLLLLLHFPVSGPHPPFLSKPAGITHTHTQRRTSSHILPT